MRLGTLATAMGLGGALVYLLDGERGGERRAALRDTLRTLQSRAADAEPAVPRPLTAAAGGLLATFALRRTALGRLLGTTGATLLVNTLLSRQAYGRR